jgi:hypothetical protein
VGGTWRWSQNGFVIHIGSYNNQIVWSISSVPRVKTPWRMPSCPPTHVPVSGIT